MQLIYSRLSQTQRHQLRMFVRRTEIQLIANPPHRFNADCMEYVDAPQHDGCKKDTPNTKVKEVGHVLF